MKLSQFRALIREEVKKILTEAKPLSIKTVLSTLDANAASVNFVKLDKEDKQSRAKAYNYKFDILRTWLGHIGYAGWVTVDLKKNKTSNKLEVTYIVRGLTETSKTVPVDEFMNITAWKFNEYKRSSDNTDIDDTFSGRLNVHYINAIKAGTVKSWLSNPTALKIYKELVSDYAKGNGWEKDLRAKYHNIVNTADPAILSSEAFARIVQAYVDYVMADWTQEATRESYKEILASYPLFIGLKGKVPGIAVNPQYKLAYRGLREMSAKSLKSFIQATSKIDWKQIKIAGTQYHQYVGPKKSLFTYKPHKPVQSWTATPYIASEFADSGVILATPVDNSFLLDPKFILKYGKQMDVGNEQELLRFNKNETKVTMLLHNDQYIKLSKGVMNVKEAENMNEKFEDDEGEFNLPI